MHCPVTVLGAGKIGGMISELLVGCGDYRVRVIDSDATALQQLQQRLPGIRTFDLALGHGDQLADLLRGEFALLNAAPFQLTSLAANAAVRAGVHCLDLTEDVASTREVMGLAGSSARAMIPQCGLAPGFISIAAHHLCSGFDRLQDVRMRVGALPCYPTNALKYNLTWSTDGLINEYLNPCQAIVDGRQVELPALADLEHFSLDGVNYEAFNTSGGLGTLADSLAGRVRNLSYRTVRYPGHRDLLRTLLQDLRLGEDRVLLKQILENALPVTLQDVVLVFVSVSGEAEGRFQQRSFARKIYGREINGRPCSAIQITTASGICAALDLLREGVLPQQGLVRQEQIPFDSFMENRFGCNFAAGQQAVVEQAA